MASHRVRYWVQQMKKDYEHMHRVVERLHEEYIQWSMNIWEGKSGLRWRFSMISSNWSLPALMVCKQLDVYTSEWPDLVLNELQSVSTWPGSWYLRRMKGHGAGHGRMSWRDKDKLGDWTSTVHPEGNWWPQRCFFQIARALDTKIKAILMMKPFEKWWFVWEM